MRPTTLVLLLLAAGPLPPSSLADARARMEAGDLDEARALLERAAQDPGTQVQAVLMLTELDNEIGDWKVGIEHGKRAVELLPESSQAHLQFAIALRHRMVEKRMKALFSVGKYKNALARALELDPRNVDALEEEIRYLWGAPKIVGGDKEAARRKIQELKRVDLRRALLLEISVAFGEDDPEHAETLLRTLLKRDAGDTFARWRLAFLLQGQGRYREANEHFSVLADAEDARDRLAARYQLARSRVLGGFEAEVALRLLRAYVEEDPKRLRDLPSQSAAYWRMGMAYEQMHRLDEARRSYEEALRLDGDNKEARKALKKLPPG